MLKSRKLEIAELEPGSTYDVRELIIGLKEIVRYYLL